MKKIGFYFSLVFFVILSCTNRDGEIIDLINSVKKQNDDLKAQITSLKKTTDSAMVAITKVTVSQAVTDKKLDAIQTELKSVLAQISSLSTQMTAANADLVSIKAKLDALQVKCAELVAQIATLTTTLNSTLVDLKKQVATLKNTSDSALIVITKLSAAQASSDKNIVSLQAELKNVVSQLADLSSQLGASNVDITSLKSKIDALQIKVNELIAQLLILNPDFNLTSGLVAYYPFNGNVNDVSGKGNDGAVIGANLTSNRFGIPNSAYYFSSQNCSPRIEATVNTSSITSELSISIWVKQVGNGCIAPRILDFATAPVNGPGQLQWGFSYQNLWGLGHQKSNGTDMISKNYSTGPLVWTHLVYTNDGSTCKFYQDGKLLGTSPNGTGKPILARNLTIGRMNHPSFDAFNGNLDDLGIWNRALTPEEIKYLYENDFKL
jgi:uncharacterized coiled-coil DUF342 family protein